LLSLLYLYKMSYPVLEIVDELRQHLHQNRIVIVQAPPGAGKSTVLPLQLLHEPWLGSGKIIMMEPRRLATRSVASRMSSILNESVGDTIGYRVRFDTMVSDKTKIEVVTEGILTRMIQHDNGLSETGLLIFDEFHERSLHADTALALSLQVQQVLRPDLRIMIMSATLDAGRLSSILGDAPVVTSTGKQYPVTIKYFPPEQSNSLQHTIRSIRKAYHENSGDILTFLPGAGEIARAEEMLRNENIDAEIYPLFGDLSYKKQQEAILPHSAGKRKIILATSIAETSLTIEGISIVIDSGSARVPRFDPNSGLTSLETVRVTKDAADQRTGRAGRLGPGVCYRLWSESVQSNLIPQRVPEIIEADLAPLMLELANWGVKDFNELTWITPPPSGSANQATALLRELKAIDSNGITVRGKAMLRFPTHPRIAHMLLEASSMDVKNSVSVASDLAALLEERDPLGREAGADISLRIEMLRNWRSGNRVKADVSSLERIEKLAKAWRKLLKIETDNSHVDETLVGRLLMEAYPERIARQTEKHSTRYKLANGRVAKLPDNDPLLKEKWISIAHVDAGAGEGKIFMAAPLAETDLSEIAEERETVKWDEDREMISGRVEKHISGFTISSRPLNLFSDDLRIKELLRVFRNKGLKILGWSDTHDEWQARILSIRNWRPDDQWPDVSNENLLRTADEWLSPFLGPVFKLADFQKLDLHAVLSSIIPWNLSVKLDALVPVRMQVPSGSMIKVNYSMDGGPPSMEVRLQEVFGLSDTPTVNEGRTKIVMHLLSPGYKPVQVTQDLKSFWNTTYAEVRKELRPRYPRHSWPDDPWTAEAVRGAKRRTV
jgi:ATP-dependent helicase HrpB